MDVSRKISPGSLFPFMSGHAFGTGFELRCGWCGKVYNKGVVNEDDVEGISVNSIRFGSLEVAECCFRDIENAVVSWLPEIIPWLRFQANQKTEEAIQFNKMVYETQDLVEKL